MYASFTWPKTDSDSDPDTDPIPVICSWDLNLTPCTQFLHNTIGFRIRIEIGIGICLWQCVWMSHKILTIGNWHLCYSGSRLFRLWQLHLCPYWRMHVVHACSPTLVLLTNTFFCTAGHSVMRNNEGQSERKGKRSNYIHVQIYLCWHFNLKETAVSVTVGVYLHPVSIAILTFKHYGWTILFKSIEICKSLEPTT